MPNHFIQFRKDFTNSFYRATTCVSAVFARFAAVYDCLFFSVKFVYCIQTAEDIVKLLSSSINHSSFFDPRRWYPVLRGRGRNGATGRNSTGAQNTLSPFISETVRDNPMVAMER